MKVTDTAHRLKEYMSSHNLKQVDILVKVKPYCEEYNVKMNKSDLSQYVSGKTEPGQDKLFVLAKALGVSEPWLMGYDDGSTQNSQQFPYEKFLQEINNPNNNWVYRVPLYASVQKENDKIVPYNFIKWISTDDERAKNYIALLIPGEEFEPKFTDKDIALINQQNTLENNKYFYILINGNLPTIRKVSFKENDTIILQADNPQIGIELASANDIVVGKLISIQKTENYE